MPVTPIEKRIASIAKRFGRAVGEVTEMWIERSAIREIEGGMNRHVADGEALSDVTRILDRQTDLGARSGVAVDSWRTG